MYYYANIDDTGLCCDLLQSETPIDDPYYIPIDSYDRTYMLRKRYINGIWTDTTVEEVAEMAMIGEQVAMFEENKWLEDVLDEKAPLEHTHEGYASSDHTHTEYVSSDDLQVLEDIVSTKADSNHTHSGFADVNHSHSEYATQTSVDELEVEVNGKADVSHSHTEYAMTSHEHDDYAEIGHDHDSAYSPLSHSHTEYVTNTDFEALEIEVDGKASSTHTHTASEIGAAASGHNHNLEYSDINHDHDEDYSPLGHSHSDYATVTSIDELSSIVSGKANTSDLNSHTGNAEIHVTDAQKEVWNAKSDFSGNYNDLTNKPVIPSINGLASEDYVDEKVGAITVESIGALPNTTVIPTVPTNVSAFTNDAGYLTEHQSLSGLATESYVDTQISAIDIPSALSDLTTDSTHRVVTDAEKAAWNAKSNFSGSYNDLTNKPSIPSISGLATETYVDEAVSGKANSSHTHTIANVSGLQNALNNKSDTTHNHTGVYDVSGAAASALSSANTYTDEAIDTLSETVAAKANSSALTSHTGNTTVHISSTERTNWNAAKTHADSAHAPTTNATQTASGLMSADDKAKLDGITAGANNYTLPSAGTNLGGVKSGGDVTISGGIITVNDDSHNHVISNVDGLQSALDGKASSGHNHDGVYYTETEVDTLLSGKANSSHAHTIANITNLQTTLDGKAAASHGTHVSYSTTAPVMDGSASVGTASTVARSDHKHPTDTSRAAKTELDALATTVSGKANSSHTHTIANVTNLQTTLDGKASSSHTHAVANISDLTATATELNYMDGVTSNVQTQLDGKAASGHSHNTHSEKSMSNTDLNTIKTAGWYYGYTGMTNAPQQTIAVMEVLKYSPDWIVQRFIVVNGAEYIRYWHSATTWTEWKTNIRSDNIGSQSVNYATSAGSATKATQDASGNTITSTYATKANVQTQLDGKASSSHTHNYAGSSSAGGAATSANKLNTNAGSATQPVYFTNGVPVKTTYTLGASVPSGAKFTDTTYGVVTTSANGLMSASDKSKLDGMVLATVSEVETYLAI